MKITNEHRIKLIRALKEFYAKHPEEQYNIFQFVRQFKERHKRNKQTWLGIAGEAGCLLHSTKLYKCDSSLGELYNYDFEWIPTKSMLKNGEVVKSLSKIVPSGKKKVFKIVLKDDRSVIASEEHIFFIEDFKEMQVKDLKKGMRLVTK